MERCKGCGHPPADDEVRAHPGGCICDRCVGVCWNRGRCEPDHRALLREAADALDAAMAHTCGLAGRDRCALCRLIRRLREAAK